MSGYTSFAKYYDALTANVDYSKRAENLSRFIRENTRDAKLVLDLACGTGSLSFALQGLGYEVIGADASSEMLSVAMQKNQDSRESILFLNQQMEELDLYGTVDATICALDSINHIESEERLLTVFKKVSLFTNPGGLFIFDVNTQYKHRDILGGNVFVYDLPEVYCCWQNAYCEKTGRVDITLDFFSACEDGRYSRETESFSEWPYEDEILSNIIKKAGFLHIETLDGDTFSPPRKNTQRLVYITKKK